MPVTLATTGAKASSPFAVNCSDRCTPRPDNDNACAQPGHDRLIEAALRHFVAHGLGSARAAYAEAERALAAGDIELSGEWLDICSAFDRRLGAELQRRLGTPTRSPATAI